MPKILRSKKGISPILATLLLIVIAVAAIVITYAWVMTFMGAQSGAAGTLYKVVNVYWDTTNNETKIDVQNIGTSTAEITKLYIGTDDSNLQEVTAFTDIGTGRVIEREDTITVTLLWPNGHAVMWQSNEDYWFKVLAKSGTEVISGPHEAD